MARKKKENPMETEANGTVAAETPPETTESRTDPPPESGNGSNGEKRHPAFKVGPIPTDRNNAVSVAVWANEVESDGRTFTVYNLTCEARWRDASGEWKSGKQYRGSQVYALIYCLQRASDWICAQRDPQQSPF